MRKLLAKVAHRNNLESVVRDFVDHTIWLVEHLTHRRLMPLRDYSALLGQVREQFDPLDQRLKPSDRSLRAVERDVVDRRLSVASSRRRPDDSQRFSLALSSATTSS